MNPSHLTAVLQQVYDSDPADPSLLQAQLSRYQEALRAFRLAFGPGPVHVYRAPGRVNLIGEHTDYNHGFVLPMALEKDILLLARPRADSRVTLRNIEPARFPDRSFTLSPSIPPGPVGDWANYVKGPAQALVRLLGIARGMDALVVGKAPFGVPIGAGLSSSSALTVVSAMALLDLNNGSMPPMEFAHFCAQAEWYVGTRGGVMDHFTSVLGRRGHALFLDCRPAGVPPTQYRTEWVPLPPQYSILVCDSGKRRANTLSDYNVRVAECKLGVALLQRRWPAITHLRDVTAEQMGFAPAELDAFLAEHLPEEADFAALRQLDLSPAFLDGLAADHRLTPTQTFRVRARCRHVIRENQRVIESADALRASDGRRFGRYMLESHQSLRDDYEASCAEVDVLVDLLAGRPEVLGARLTGAGWGGCVVALLDAGAETGFMAEVAETYKARTGLALEWFAGRAAAGVNGWKHFAEL